MPPYQKTPKKYSKKELDKIRKQTGACEHDQVNYKSLEELNELLKERLKKDGNSLTELVESNYKLSSALDKKTRQMVTWQKAGERSSKLMNEREKEWGLRLEVVTKVAVDWRRKYEGLFGLKESAEEMGIDTENHVATEEDKQFIKDHDFEHAATQLESGKIRNTFNLKKKRTEGHFYFGKWVPGKKKKKPNGENK